MALVDTKSSILIPALEVVSGTSTVMDATGERVGSVIQITKAGNISAVWIMLGTITEEDTIKISLQGVGTDGLPNGTILGAGNNGFTDNVTFTDANDNTWLGPFALDVAVAVTQGQFISVVVEWASYADGNLSVRQSSTLTPLYNAYTVTDVSATPGTWIKGNQNSQYCVALEYDVGTYGRNNFGAGYYTSLTVGSGTTPDEIGNYVSYPFPGRAIGIWVYGDLDYDVTLSLQSSDGTTLANCTLEADYRFGTGAGPHHVLFDADPASSVTIAKDTNYRVVATPGADSVSIRVFDMPEAAAMGAFDLGTNCVYTSRVDAGAWSQTDTRRCCIGLIFDQLDDGASSGGGGPLIGGRLVR